MELQKSGLMTTANGEIHGLINVVSNSVHDDGFKHMKPETKKKAEALKKDEQRIVSARYLNSRGSHERLERPYMRWAGERIEMWKLIPGEVYNLPYGFVKEINESKGLAKRSEILDSNGIPTKKDGQNEKIHQLVPVSF